MAIMRSWIVEARQLGYSAAGTSGWAAAAAMPANCLPMR
ncbi:hypothetical protein RGCCGE502_16395 [Rhizobium grahamii CCGE 502]|uniref:Uncharacterized protein n=1 Tax=Rhizobium grahamii CCGE 502 TaxID=990285 RepID=S3HGK3_9HYPH|nr:hypothetical protein RGCCGE502_16395 [Rhizobium grahamii CCGE 502]